MITLDPFESVFRPLNKRTEAPSSDSEVSAPAPADANFPLDFKQTVQDFEIELIQQALQQSQFNQKKTAEALQVTYHQLRGYMKKYDLFDNE